MRCREGNFRIIAHGFVAVSVGVAGVGVGVFFFCVSVGVSGRVGVSVSVGVSVRASVSVTSAPHLSRDFVSALLALDATLLAHGESWVLCRKGMRG